MFLRIVLRFFIQRHIHPRRRINEDEILPIRTTWGVMGKEELDQTIFRPSGFWLREYNVIPALEYLDLPNCSHVMSEWLARNLQYGSNRAVPTKVPKGVMDMFTKNGLIQLLENTDNKKYERTPVTWTIEQIEEIFSKKTDKYEEHEEAMLHAMETVGLKGKTGLVSGSSKQPWIEAIALHAGAAKLVRTGPVNITIENYCYVQYVDSFEMAQRYHTYLNSFEFAAYVSIENMGFGRVDPFNPNGDILEIQKMYCMLKNKGILFLGVPIGWDTVIWNTQRIYGRLRLSMIAAAWDLIAIFHYDNEIRVDYDLFEKTSTPGDHKWVVVVLRKRHSTIAHF